ncbi:H-type small acid-soluble spore protein [Alicyclobacillus cycloheptanicus]|uniref:H-type small acid-soluble spore protein n=1 Tax=Alicyclobacillus cycloheptanicus TaxID=1457 RepID=A0ABT9XHJ9_9BACL|nr:H-type small acid-soluble spore protein [Alicyclobacillus cycloheptanicus]MDQ0189662.1 H-type small acid-soluble spore protein [Alicyclobacillus cycloheptanicus]WDL99961.1 H-type small acid-soluble spore protein [Alicyclobacillus cycloheptanicus]
MHADRAKQIITAPSEILVTLEGDPVWIDEVDDSTNTALVHSLESGRHIRVEVDRLHES